MAWPIEYIVYFLSAYTCSSLWFILTIPSPYKTGLQYPITCWNSCTHSWRRFWRKTGAWKGALIKKSYMTITASSYMGKYLRFSSYFRQPFLITDFASCNCSTLNFLTYEENWFSFYQCAEQLLTQIAAFALVMDIFRRPMFCSSSRLQTPLYLERELYRPLLSGRINSTVPSLLSWGSGTLPR